jgi:hypothetical protein
MNEFNDWFQNNGIDLARLSVQIAILAMVVRYGRKLLATLRASQEQVGALLKLSVSDAVQERQAATTPEPARRFEPPAAAFSEPEPEPEPEPVFAGAPSRSSYADEREHTLGGRVLGSPSPAFSTPTLSSSLSSPSGSRAENPAYTPWVSAPATDPDRFHAPVAAPIGEQPRASTWVQPPAPPRRNGVGPWRKMVRWLQAPVRS